MFDVKQGILKCSSGDFLHTNTIHKVKIDRQTADITEILSFRCEVEGVYYNADFTVLNKSNSSVEFRPTPEYSDRRELYNNSLYPLLVTQYDMEEDVRFALDYIVTVKYFNKELGLMGSDSIILKETFDTKESLDAFVEDKKNELDNGIRAIMNSLYGEGKDCYIKEDSV